MTGIYQHKKTGAKQIFSDRSVEILKEIDVWEFVEEFNPVIEQPVQKVQQVAPKIPINNETPPLREVLPNAGAEQSPEDEEESLNNSQNTTPVKNLTQDVQKNKGGRPKVVRLEDLP